MSNPLNLEEYFEDVLSRRFSKGLEKFTLVNKLNETTKKTSITGTASLDKLIEMKISIPSELRKEACWILNDNDIKSIGSFKYADGKSVLKTEIVDGIAVDFVLGIPVVASDVIQKVTLMNINRAIKSTSTKPTITNNKDTMLALAGKSMKTFEAYVTVEFINDKAVVVLA